MSETYVIEDGAVKIITDNPVSIKELKERCDFWRAEIARIKAEYTFALEAAEAQFAVVNDAIAAAKLANIEGAADIEGVE